MKVTEENVATIATWAGLALLVIAGNFSRPPWELTLPAWLIFCTGIGIRISRTPADNPYKRAFIMMALPMIILLPASAFGRDFFLLLTHPSMAHLVMPRPFLVAAILYLGLACVFMNIKIDDLVSQIRGLREIKGAEGRPVREEPKQVGLRPAIRIGEKVIIGERGETHSEIEARMKQPEIMKEKLPREVTRGTIELAPGVEAEVVYLDNGESGYTEGGMETYLDWLQSKSMRHRFERLWKSLIQKAIPKSGKRGL